MLKILGGIQHAFRVLLGKNPARRALTVMPGDVFIVSYPKSGNTWTRFLIGNLVHPTEPVTFANVEEILPSIYVHPDRVLRRLPRILKSHEAFDPRYPKVIYIVRDPRDVSVSYYHYCRKRGWINEGCTIAEFVPRFLAAEFEIHFGTWADNVMSWVALRSGNPNFLLLRYEDMIAQSDVELAKVARFLGIEATPELIARAVALSSADRMRELEKKEGDSWALTKGTRKDVPFIRAAKAGGWRNSISPAEVEKIETQWGEVMTRVGYQLSTDALSREPVGSARRDS